MFKFSLIHFVDGPSHIRNPDDEQVSIGHHSEWHPRPPPPPTIPVPGLSTQRVASSSKGLTKEGYLQVSQYANLMTWSIVSSKPLFLIRILVSLPVSSILASSCILLHIPTMCGCMSWTTQHSTLRIKVFEPDSPPAKSTCYFPNVRTSCPQ